MTEEKLNIILNEYIEWLSFKNDDSYKVFYMNLKMLYKICIIMANGLDIKQKDINVEDLTEINLFDKLDMIKNFFKEVNIDIDVETLINNGSINFSTFDKNDIKNNLIKYLKGHCQKTSNNNYDILSPNSNLILDSIITAHELGHYTCKTDNTSLLGSLFEETSSLYAELLYYDYLNKRGYKNECDILKSIRLSKVIDISKKYIPILKILDVYITFGTLSKENYNKLYNDDYNKVISKINDSELFYRIKRDLVYVVGMYMAIIMRNKFKNDYSYSQNIKNFNKNIDNMDFSEISNILDIDFMDDSHRYVIDDYIKGNKKIN